MLSFFSVVAACAKRALHLHFTLSFNVRASCLVLLLSFHFVKSIEWIVKVNHGVWSASKSEGFVSVFVAAAAAAVI